MCHSFILKIYRLTVIESVNKFKFLMDITSEKKENKLLEQIFELRIKFYKLIVNNLNNYNLKTMIPENDYMETEL